jgi:hypothetical protein
MPPNSPPEHIPGFEYRATPVETLRNFLWDEEGLATTGTKFHLNTCGVFPKRNSGERPLAPCLADGLGWWALLNVCEIHNKALLAGKSVTDAEEMLWQIELALKDTERSKHQLTPASENAHLGLSWHASPGFCRDRSYPDSSENDGKLYVIFYVFPRSNIKLLGSAWIESSRWTVSGSS